MIKILLVQRMHMRIFQSGDQASAVCVDQAGVPIFKGKDLVIVADCINPAGTYGKRRGLRLCFRQGRDLSMINYQVRTG
jgi:hypothetical protein